MTVLFSIKKCPQLKSHFTELDNNKAKCCDYAQAIKISY